MITQSTANIVTFTFRSFPAVSHPKAKNNRVITTPGNSAANPGAEEKLLIPANRITTETRGSANTAARTVPRTAPMTAAIPKRRARVKRSFREVKPIAR